MRNILKYINNNFSNDYNNWILWLPVFFGVGICSYFSLGYEPDIRYILGAVVFTSFCAYVFRKKTAYFFFLIIILMIFSGFAVANFRSIDQYSPVVSENIGAVGIKGRVVEVKKYGKGKRIILSNIKIRDLDYKNTPVKIRLNVKTAHNDVKEGGYISVFAHISPPPKAVIPGGYNFAQYAYFNQIGAVGYALTEIRILKASKENNFNEYVQKIRHGINDKITSTIGENSDFATALITGERGGIDRKTLSSIRQAGIAHILAISGLHLSLVAALFFFSSRLIFTLLPSLALHYNVKKWAAIIAIFGSFAYLMISGAPISAQRAFIMTSLILLAVIIDRSGTPMRSVAFAALIVMIISPESVLTPSFQMSFAAVIALIAFFDYFRKSYENIKDWSVFKKFLVYFLSVMASSLVAGLATSAYSIYHFNNLSTYGVITNLIAIPTTSFLIMPMGILSVVLMPVGLEYLPLQAMSYGISILIDSAEFISSLPAASGVVKSTTPFALALITFGGLWLCLWKQNWRFLGVIIIFLGVMVANITPVPDILIEGKSGVYAVKTKTGEWAFSSKRKARYTRERWLGAMGANHYISAKEYEGDDFVCDEESCSYYKNGKKILISSNAVKMVDYCAEYDFVINLSYLNVPCSEKAVNILNMNEIKQKVSFMIFINKYEIISKNTVDSIGDRPWNY